MKQNFVVVANRNFHSRLNLLLLFLNVPKINGILKKNQNQIFDGHIIKTFAHALKYPQRLSGSSGKYKRV